MTTTPSQNADTAKAVTTKKRLMRRLAGGLGLIAAAMMIVVCIAPTLLSTSRGQALLQRQLNALVEGHLTFARLALGWLSGIEVRQLAFDSPDGATQVRIDRLAVQPRWLALLGGTVDLGKTVIDQPNVSIQVAPPSEKTPLPEGAPRPAPTGPLFIPAHRMNLTITDGNVQIAGALSSVQFKNLAAQVDLKSPDKLSTATLRTTVSDGKQEGTIAVSAQAQSSAKSWTLADTSGNVKIQIQNLNLATLQPLLAMAGIDFHTGGMLNANGDVQLDKGQLTQAKMVATVENFSQLVGGQKIVFDKPVKLDVNVQAPQGNLVIQSLNADTPFGVLKAAGSLEAMNFELTDADLAGISAFARQFAQLGGFSATGTGQVKGNLTQKSDSIALAASGMLRKVQLKKGDLTAPTTDLSFQTQTVYNMAKRTVALTDTNATFVAGAVRIPTATFGLDQDAAGFMPMSVKAAAQMDLAKLAAFAPLFTDALTGYMLAGTVDANAALEAQKGKVLIEAAPVKAQNLRIAKAGAEPFNQQAITLNARIALDMLTKSIDIQAFDLQGGDGQTLIKIQKGTFQQTQTPTTGKLDAQFDVEYDVAALTGLAQPFLPAGFRAEGKRRDTIAFQSTWPLAQPEKKIANLTGKAALGFDQAQFQGLNFGKTQLLINAGDGKAAIQIPDAPVNGGTVRFAGTVFLDRKPMVLVLDKPATIVDNIQLNPIVAHKLLRFPLPIFANSVRVSGVASLNCQTLTIPLGDAPVETIDIAGTISLNDVRIQSPLLATLSSVLQINLERFTMPPSAFTVRNGIANCSQMSLIFDDGRFTLRFSGMTDLRNEALRMNIAALTPNRTLNIPLSGTLSKPEVDVAGLILGNIVEQMLRRESQ